MPSTVAVIHCPDYDPQRVEAAVYRAVGLVGAHRCFQVADVTGAGVGSLMAVSADRSAR